MIRPALGMLVACSLAVPALGCASTPSGVVIRTFPSTPRAVSEVKRGWAVAAVGDFPVMAHTARESTGTLEVVGQQFEVQNFGIGVRKEAPDLKAAVTDALRRIMEDQSYINVLRDWGITIGKVGPPPQPERVLPTAEVAQLADGDLKVGMELAFPPMEFMDERNREAGADVQLAKALAKALGVEVVFVNLRFDSLIGNAEVGTVDVVLSSMTITPEREKLIDFIPYLRSGSGILVQKGNPHQIRNPEDLCGRTVALQEATAQVDLMKSLPCE